MATAATGVEPKETECAECYSDFTDPKILPCAHLLCRDCLVTWLKSDNENQCPMCFCVIVDRGDLASKSCEDIADALPTDLAMAALVESVRILNKDHVCVVCVNVAATGLCLQCGDMLCSSCVTAHKRLSGTRHHKVESLTSLTPESLSASRPTSCSVHSDRSPELFCPTHGVCVCLLCAMSDHQSCQKEKLEARVKEACAVLDQLAATLTEGEHGLERAISQLDQDLADMDKNTQAAMAEIDAAYDRLQYSLQAWRCRLKELIKEANADTKAAMHVGRAELLERRGKLTSHLRLAQRVKQTTPPSSMDEMSSKLKTRVAGLDYSDTLPEDVKRVTVKKLTLDPQTLTRIEKELDSLGQLTPATHITPGTAVTHVTPVTHVTSAASHTQITTATSFTSATLGTCATSAGLGGTRYMSDTPDTRDTSAGPGIHSMFSTLRTRRLEAFLASITPGTRFTPATPGAPVTTATPATRDAPVTTATPATRDAPVTTATPATRDAPVTTATPGAPVTTTTAATPAPHITQFRFHNNHKNTITLSRSRRGCSGHGILLSSVAMMTNALYEVTVEETDLQYGGAFLIGVTNQNPTSLTVPDDAWEWNEAVVIRPDCVRSYGRQVKTTIGHELVNLPLDSRVGLLVDGAGSLHLYLGRRDKGVAATNITHPVYAFFDVQYPCKKLRVLPVTLRD